MYTCKYFNGHLLSQLGHPVRQLISERSEIYFIQVSYWYSNQTIKSQCTESIVYCTLQYQC